MKKRYKKAAYLVDDGVLLFGYIDKYGFHPNDKGCGFGREKVNKKQLGKIWFKKCENALKKVGPLEIVGGEIVVFVDVGLYLTKCIGGNCLHYISFYTEEVNYDIKEIVAEYLYKIGCKGCSNVFVDVVVTHSSFQAIPDLSFDMDVIETSVMKHGYNFNFVGKITVFPFV